MYKPSTRNFFVITVAGVLFGNLQFTRAGCIAPTTEASVFDGSQVAGRFKVLTSQPFIAEDQTIQTRVKLKVLERFKGKVPAEVVILTAGGTVGNKSDIRSDSISLVPGESYVLLLKETAKGVWSAHPFHAFRARDNQPEVTKFFRGRARGPSPKLMTAGEMSVGTDQGADSTVPGSVVGYYSSNGDPTRFTTCDTDEAIPYLTDIDPTKLPPGMTESSAIATVAECLAAWSSSSSLKFRFEGVQSFGMAASSITTQDRRLRIQLHDTYNAINSIGTQGIGGGGFRVSSNFTGGKLGTQGFQERLYGYVVMESAANTLFFNVLANFKRALTHEIGHALGLAHSSEDALELDPTLKGATMYYVAPFNSAGATIQPYDVGRIQLGYPVNTPPSSVDRTFTAVTAASYATAPLNNTVLGVNRIRLLSYDRQGTALTASLVVRAAIIGPPAVPPSPTIYNGTFTLDVVPTGATAGVYLNYRPKGNYKDSDPLDPVNPKLTDAQIEAGYFLDQAEIQFSDGVNLSRVVKCSVVAFANDSVTADGLPDKWMKDNFGTTAAGTNVGVNAKRLPDADPDGDGLTNRMEFMLGTNPNDASSGMPKPTMNASGQLSFTPTRFASYVIESSPSLAPNSWTVRGIKTSFSGAAITANFLSNSAPVKEFYRVSLAPVAP